MKKRPLCMLCLTFLIIKGILLMMTSGDGLVKVPASSIFYEQEEKQDILIQGQVYKKTNTSKNQILYLKNNSIFDGIDSYYESNIIIYDDSFADASIGETLLIKGALERFEGARNPGNFDQQLYYAKQHIYGFAWCEKIIRVTGTEHVLSEKLYQLRQRWKDLLFHNMSGENGAVLSAMLLGDKSEMDEEIKELYQKNGISHVLAISGLHISFIGLGIYHLLRKAGLSYPLAGVLALTVLSGYVFMIGFSVSVLRAYVMLVIRIGADIAGRVYDMLTALMVAAVIVVVYQPLYLADAAFYMSYGAILGILIVLPQIRKLLPWKKKFVEGCLASIAINIALFPVLLWFYFEFPVYSIVLNMIVIPLMSWVLGLGIFGSCLCLLWEPLGGFLLQICDLILSLFTWLGEVGAGLPFSQIVFGKPEWWEVGIYYALLMVGIVLLHKFVPSKQSVPVQREKKTHMEKSSIWKTASIGFMLFMVFSLFLFVKFPNGKLQVTMLDVGQGDCIFVKGPEGTTYLIDGGSSDVDKVGRYRIEPFLKSQGVGTLDYVFLSHGDSDHYSGIQEMLERQEVGVKIATLVFPANYTGDDELLELVSMAKENDVATVVMRAGQTLQEGELAITCLQPNKDGSVGSIRDKNKQSESMQELEGNAGSMVLDVSFGKFDMLLTGDVEEKGEEVLIQNLHGKSYDVLKVAHHGSKNSTSEAFLKLVKPKMSLISAGEDNSYGHPHEETLERLGEVESKLYRTMDYGAIQLETDGDFIDIFQSSI